MKVAIDTGPLTSGHSIRGIGVHTRLLLEHLQKLKGLEVDAVDFSKADLGKYDIAHYQFFNPYFVFLPFFKKIKTVITVHDLTPLIYPAHYPSGIKGRMKFWLNKILMRQIDAVITISETSKKDIVRFLNIDPNKIHVVYLAPRKLFGRLKENQTKKIKQKYNLPEKFVLYVGDVNYNKNIPNLIRACKIADLSLVIVGKHAMDIETEGMGINDIKGVKDWIRFVLNKPHPELSHFRQILKAFDNNKNVLRLGFVPDSDLVAIFNLASVYCQPSFYEGFGLSVLEAFASGTPVVCSYTQALAEIAGDAALYFDPHDYKDLAQKLNKVVKDKKLSDDLTRRGVKRAKDFSWDKTAKETFEVYKKV